jgi:hypothetical protein
MSSSSQSFVCGVCGESHEGLPTDTAFTLPDEVWALPVEERSTRAKWTEDLCQFGERYFIRCLLPIPFTDQAGYYGWGVWAQVEWSIFQKYLELYDQDGTKEPSVFGLLANQIPTYAQTLGLPVRIQFEKSTERPTVQFAASQDHELAREFITGISYARYHEILLARGRC